MRFSGDRKKRLVLLSTMLFITILLLVTFGISVKAQEKKDTQNLFITYTGDALSMPTTNDPTVVRKRYVEINFNILPADNGNGLTIGLNMFDDVHFDTKVNKSYIANDGKSRVIEGDIDGESGSSVIIVRTDNVVSGNINTNDGESYQIRYEGDNIHSTRQIDQSKFPDEAPPIPVGVTTQNSTNNLHTIELNDRKTSRVVASDNTTRIDVMVAYTTSAKDAVGGQTAMENLITLGETETNQGFENSDITQRIRIVHTRETGFDEDSLSSMSAVLSALASTSDGKMDSLHTYRTQYGADLVSLWTNISSTSYCGIAYLMTTLSSSFASSAFSVVQYDCATGFYTFGHELGHNMGAMHDRNQSGSGLFSYSHGQQRPNATTPYRTVMAYACSSTTCSRVNYWSNPDITLYGKATGQAIGSSDSADNQSTLDNSLSTVYAFVDEVDSVTNLTVVPTASFWGYLAFFIASLLALVFFKKTIRERLN